MKKTYYSLLLLCCLNAITSYSQEKQETKTKRNFTLGINAGGHYSYLGGDSGYSNFYHKNKFNYVAGINAELQLNKSWSMYANLNYRPRSFTSNVTLATNNGPKTTTKEMRFSYLELPLMVKYRIENSFFYVNGGIYFAKFLSVKDILDGKDTGIDWSENQNKLDMGVVLGAGFIFYENEKETTNMSLEFRYIHGLTGLLNATEGDNSTYMNAYCLQLNYNFTP